MFHPFEMTFRSGLFPFIGLLFVAGCSMGQSADQALDKSLAANQMTRAKVYPLAGKITVDGMTPELAEGDEIVVMLIDPSKPDQGGGPARGPYAVVDKSGQFAFHTYGTDDGVEPGTYIATIAKLKTKKRKGLVGPDSLQNLYNDPDRNQKEHPELHIEHQAPGKKNYEFNLQVAGREPVEPGPKSLTQIVIRGK